ncbi:unnamed protein product, partial [Amoebophrya sp. A25]
ETQKYVSSSQGIGKGAESHLNAALDAQSSSPTSTLRKTAERLYDRCMKGAVNGTAVLRHSEPKIKATNALEQTYDVEKLKSCTHLETRSLLDLYDESGSFRELYQRPTTAGNAARYPEQIKELVVDVRGGRTDGVLGETDADTGGVIRKKVKQRGSETVNMLDWNPGGVFPVSTSGRFWWWHTLEDVVEDHEPGVTCRQRATEFGVENLPRGLRSRIDDVVEEGAEREGNIVKNPAEPQLGVERE